MIVLPEPVSFDQDVPGDAVASALPEWARHVVVIGAGLMGRQIIARLDDHGFSVTAVEPSKAQLEGARDSLESAGLVRNVVWRSSVTEVGAFDGWVLEAVPERHDLKVAVLAEAERELSPNLIASNTSSLSISALQSELQNPERMLGMHFFQPLDQTLLIELISGARTEPATSAVAEQIARSLGVYPLIAVDRPGFATSRLALALGLEAIRALEEGVAGVRDIDEGMLRGYGHRDGPLKMTDIVGLDTRLNIARFLERELGPRFSPPQLLVAMVEAGRLGRKSGSGFYDWSDAAG